MELVLFDLSIFFFFFLRNSGCDTYVNDKLLKLFFNYVVKEFYILYLYFYVETKYKIN